MRRGILQQEEGGGTKHNIMHYRPAMHARRRQLVGIPDVYIYVCVMHEGWSRSPYGWDDSVQQDLISNS